MTDLEQQRPPDPPATPLVPPEPWSVWWSRLVQVSGLSIMTYQAFFEQADRRWLLLCAMGMMLGEIGLKALLRFLIRNVTSG